MPKALKFITLILPVALFAMAAPVFAQDVDPTARGT